MDIIVDLDIDPSKGRALPGEVTSSGEMVLPFFFYLFGTEEMVLLLPQFLKK